MHLRRVFIGFYYFSLKDGKNLSGLLPVNNALIAYRVPGKSLLTSGDDVE